MKKIDLRVKKTKQNIHQALLRLLKGKPLAKINVTELCLEASINRGTFYFHYENVGQVFQECFEVIMKDLERSYREPYLHHQQLSARTIDPNTIRIFHHIKKYEMFYRIIFSKEVPIQYYYMFFDEVRNNLMSDQSHIDQQYPAYFYSYTANAMIGLIIEWHRNDFGQSAQEMNNYFVQIINRPNE